MPNPTLLISDPSLQDANFTRTVLLIAEHNADGALGFVLNKKLKQKLNDLIEFSHATPLPLYYGGPVKLDTLHFIHTRPDIIPDGKLVIDNIYWGGNFNTAVTAINDNLIQPNQIKLFVGYSGWETNQLETEIAEGSWIPHQASTPITFAVNPTTLWKNTLLAMGGDFALLANAPINPKLN